MKRSHHIYGLLAQFERPEELLHAATRAHGEGYRKMDAYSPFPVHGLAEAVGFHKSRLPLIVLLGGIFGAVGGVFMQWFAAVMHYPINIGGRPLNSWPAFIIITFELTILCAGLAAVLGMLALNGLPQPHHPLFNAPNFELASRTHFFLCIETRDAKFDFALTRAFLESLKPTRVVEVPELVMPTK